MERDRVDKVVDSEALRVNESTKILAFVAFCIECYKAKHGIAGEKAAELFCRYGVDRYLFEEYEILHTMSEAKIIDYIERFVDVRKEAE